MTLYVTEFTDEQRDKIIGNIDQIEKFLQEVQKEILEPIRVYDACGSYDLYLDKNDMYVHHYNHKVKWHLNKDKVKHRERGQFFPRRIDHDIRSDIRLAFLMAYNWEDTKKNILWKIEMQRKDKDKIDNLIYNFKA